MSRIINTFKEVRVDGIATGQTPDRLTNVKSQAYNPKKAVGIFDLKSHHCRWPVRDNARGVADLYCGEAKAYEGAPYCLSHFLRSKQSSTNQ